MAIDLKALARLGAAARLHDLDAERVVILKTFPGLGGVREQPRAVSKKRKISAAGRAAIRAGAKKRWAEWKKAQAAKEKQRVS